MYIYIHIYRLHIYTYIYITYIYIGSMANEPINPFGIYLNLDCVTNLDEDIDKWETALRISVAVNKMNVRFLE
jgi:hypothetical protein